LLAIAPAPECHLDGDSPLGPDPCVLVVKEEPDRRRLTPDATSAHGDEARQVLQRGPERGRQVPAACSASSPRCTAAIQAVSPQARGQAAPGQTVQHIGGHRPPARRAARRQVKARGEAQPQEASRAWAKTCWAWRGRLLPQPSQVAGEATPARTARESEAAGVVHRGRSLLRPLGQSLAQAHRAAPATLRLHQRRKASQAMAAPHRAQSPQGLDAHWEQALRELRQQGLGTHRRGSHSESGRRRLRRLEKNHAGLRSAATRQHYIQIYQAIKDLSLDIAAFIEQGPHMAELPGV
jgi:hypothetical protein